MEVVDNVYKFIDYPPLYTEQINNLTLTKQLEIWEGIIRSKLLNDSLKLVVDINDVNNSPFKNININRHITSSFLTLILQFLIEKNVAFYIHPIEDYCTKRSCTVWSCLFNNRKNGTNNLYNINSDYKLSLNKGTSSNIADLDVIKSRRNSLMDVNYKIGIFPYNIEEMCSLVLQCINSQCTTDCIETVYYLFYNKKDINKDLNLLPEVHLAFILSTLSFSNKIQLTCNESVPINSLTTKHVGIQPV